MCKNKYILISLAVLTVLGALFTVLASNMFFSDVGNIAVGMSRSTILITLPAMGVASTFAIAILYVIRAHKHPDCFKRISRLYAILAIVFNALGLIANIAGSIIVYSSFVSKNPFPGYSIVFLLLELAIIGGAIFGLLKLKDRKEDEGRVKVNALYVLKTVGWVLFIFLLLNRLGSFLGSPIYIYWRNFYKTFPFYLYLLVPLFLGILEVLFIFKLIDKKRLYILTFVAIGLNVCLFAYSAAMGITDTGFISSLSEAMPLERLASKPLEILIHFLAYLGVSAALLVQNKKAK